MSRHNLPSPPKTTPTILPNVPIHSPVPGGVKVYRNLLVERHHQAVYEIYVKLIKKCHQDKEIIGMNNKIIEINRKIAYIDRENSEGGIKRNHQSSKKSNPKKSNPKKRKTQKK
jgi:hypothetical protein